MCYLGKEVVGVSDQKLNMSLRILLLLHLPLWILWSVFYWKEELAEEKKILLVGGLAEVEVNVQRLLKMLTCLIQ